MRLRYSRAALGQIDRALSYVAARSPAGAAHIAARLSALADLVRLRPQAGLKTQLADIRRIYLTPYPYLVDYHIRDDEIVILRFRHTSRRPPPSPERA